MTKTIAMGGVVGGAVLFLWGFVSWRVLPWHGPSFNGFNQERVVEVVLQSNAPQKGIYLLPHLHKGTPEEQRDAQARAAKGPFAFVAFSPKGWGSMPSHLVTDCVTQVLASALVTALLLGIQRPKSNFLERWIFVALFALTGGIVCYLPFWNWWGFSTRFILLSFADLLIGWSLAGLVIAWLTAGTKKV